MAFDDFEIYPGKKVSDLFKDIVTNSEQTKGQIQLLVADLRPLVKSPGDAIAMTPLIQNYIESEIKNDDALVKLAAISQRIMVTKQDTESGGGMITEEERAQLMKEIDATISEQQTSRTSLPPTIKKKIEIEKLKEEST